MFVKQKKEDDCGICCLSMLTGLSYDEAKTLIFYAEYHGKLSTTTRDIADAISRMVCFTSKERLTVVKSWDSIPNNSLVKIRSKTSHNWHWVMWRKKKIYDPARGVFKPSKFDKKPSSYLLVNKDSTLINK